MTPENYIESQFRELQIADKLDPEFLDLYENIKYEPLKNVLASLHKQFTVLFRSMNDRLPTKKDGAHFWADPSRELIFVIDMVNGLVRCLKKSNYAFHIEEYYEKLIEKCESFLSGSGGSTLPEHMEKVILYYTEPIFIPNSTKTIKRKGQEIYSDMKLIGEGSYAKVFKFKDEFYKKSFILKRANKDLNVKEYERFKREFHEMKNLNSPYVVEVFAYDDAEKEYTMELMDFSLDEYIKKNNSKLPKTERVGLVLQILKAFKYLSSKNILHRDVSPKNILLRKYEDVIVVKLSDFGLVKIPDSELTSMDTDIKGYFNDPRLVTDGFDSYEFHHEVYAITKIIYFVMTGKTNTAKLESSEFNSFIAVGLNSNTQERYKSVNDIVSKFREVT